MKSKNIRSHVVGVKSGLINTIYDDATIKKLMVTRQETKSFIQLINVDLVAGYNHLFVSLETAFDAFEKKTNISSSKEIEFLLRLFGERQIEKILPKLKSNNKVILIVADKNQKKVEETFKKIENEINFTEKEIQIGNKDELKKIFKIKKQQLETLKDLENPLESTIIEQVALTILKE